MLLFLGGGGGGDLLCRRNTQLYPINLTLNNFILIHKR